MREMLANHYFYSRNYLAAEKELEIALALNPACKAIKKKMIICSIQTQNINNALRLFSELVEEDIYFITNTDITKDYCPCPQLIYEYENSSIVTDENRKNLILGMLWLYCDIRVSIDYFEKVNTFNSSNTTTINLLKKLNQTLTVHH